LRVKAERDDLSVALEGLRNRPIVAESREYARRWERSRARVASIRLVLFGSAGAIAAACMLAYAAFTLLSPNDSAASKGLVETRIGETRAITLGDGSRMVLDTISRVRVVFTGATRDIELLDGQAHFEVAKDAARPFRVRTKSAEVIAVGTMFDVAASPARTTVTLIEGRVNVRPISASPPGESKPELLTPGQQLGISSDGRLLGARTVKIENVTAWQRGTIVIDDMPLVEALAVMNRYSAKHLVVLGQALQARRVSGVFRIGDVETESVVLERFFGLREVSRSEREIVLDRN
jgi:transmembrane sensor